MKERRLRSKRHVDLLNLVLLGVVSMLMQGFYLQTYIHTLPDALSPSNDARQYWEMGQRIYREGWLLPKEGPFYQAPLYSYQLGLQHHLGWHRVREALNVQAWMAVGNVLLTYLLARFFVGPAWSLLAGGLYGFSHYSLFFSSKLLATTQGIFLFLFFGVVLLLWIRKKKIGWLILAALLYALAVLSRPQWLFVLAILWPVFFLTREESGYTIPGLRWKVDSRGGIFLLVFLVGILPSLLRNGLVGGDWVPFTANAGVTLYMGTNSQAQGGLGAVEGLSNDIADQQTQSIERASEEAGRGLSPSEASNYWIKKTLAWVVRNPLDFLVLEVKKGLWSVYPSPPAVNYSAHYEAQWIPWLDGLRWVTWLNVWGGLGLLPFVAWRERKSRFLLAVLGGYFLLVLVYYASDRFLASVLSFTSILFVFGLREVLRSYQEGDFFIQRKTWMKVGWLGVMLLLTLNPALGYNREREVAMGWYNLGVFYEERQQESKAMEAYEKAVEHREEFPSALLNLGVLHARRGNLQKSTRLFRKVLELAPENQRAQRNLQINMERMRGDSR